MIAKQIKGDNFNKCLNYLLSKKAASLIGGNMSGRNKTELTTEFYLSQQLHSHRRTAKNVYHVSLAVPMTEQFNQDQWMAIAQDYLTQMGFNNNQYLIVLHQDTDHNHIHLVTSRFKLDGTIVSDSWDYRRSQRILRELEQKYQLTTTTTKNPLKKSPTTGEKRLNKRTGNLSIRQQLQQTIDQACLTKQTLPELIKQLHLEGINIQINFNQQGQPRGISYELNNLAFTGSNLGKAYSFNGLQKYKNINYNLARDLPELLWLNQQKAKKTARNKLFNFPSIEPIEIPINQQFKELIKQNQKLQQKKNLEL
jgi:hypothetical protein